jgi:phosphonate degradation associated HDIG domain protein
MSSLSPELSARVERALAGLTDGAAHDYIGEPLSQLGHALQCAARAEAAGAPQEEVLAALFHDIGHLVAPHGTPEMAGLGILEHERIGAEWLRALGFAPVVCELVAAHVAAKRYLAFRNQAYLERLSPASRGTLDFQGGPMSAAEASAFEADPSFKAKVRLRSWDEAAKDPHFPTPEISHFAAMVRTHLEQR